MSFYLTKTLLAFLLPPASLLILLALGLLLLKVHAKRGITLLSLGLMLLYLASIRPVAHGLMNGLESEYPPFKRSKGRPDAIVVLTGGVREISWAGIKQTPGDASLARVIEGIVLYRAYIGSVPLVISGGCGDPEKRLLPEAGAVAETAVSLGVPKNRILVEDGSRNTRESAAAVAKLVKGKRIVLVTSAFHMKRSVRMFEKQGFTVHAAPTDFRSSRRPVTPHAFIPTAGNLFLTSTALQEHLSRAWYGMRGEM